MWPTFFIMEAVNHIRPSPRTVTAITVLPCRVVLVKAVTGQNKFRVVVDTDHMS